MKMSRWLWSMVGSLFVAGAGFALAETAPVAAADSTPVVRVGSTTVTESELQQKYGPQLYDAEKNLYMTRVGLAREMARDILFDNAAKAAGLSRQAWEKKEIDSKVQAPTAAEIDDIVKRMQEGRPSTDPSQLAQMRQQATAYLSQQKREAAENAAVEQLSKASPIEVLLSKPVAPRVEVPFNAKLNPSKGPSTAPVTIVEFTDFQCPWCKRSQPALDEVEKTYGNQLRIVAHNFPLPMHPRAEPAAQAALCAKDQGKYWEYRDKLFDKQELSDADFTRYAQELHLNQKKFDKCLAGHKHAKEVQDDIALGQKSGVQGTPTFFVNGIKIGYTELDDTVKAELAKPEAKKPSAS